MSSVIILDGQGRKALSLARSLGKLGHDISIVTNTLLSPAIWSNFCSRFLISKTYTKNKFFFLKTLKNLNIRNKPLFLIPLEDETVLFISKHKKEISRYYKFLIPKKKNLELAINKYKISKVVKKLNIDCPHIFHTKSASDIKKIIKNLYNQNELDDYILKPESGYGSLGIIYLSKKYLNFDWKKHIKIFGKCFVQKKIISSGDAIGCSFLFNKNSKCVANFVHKRIFQYPILGGPSTYRVSVKNDLLKKKSIKILKKLKWKGVAMVEWKIDPKTQIPYFLEINPRFWGSVELSGRSGINFPSLYLDILKNKKIKKKDYMLGIKCRWVFPGDLLRYLSDDKRESIFKYFKNFFNECEEWDKKDIMGFFGSVICSFLYVFKISYWKYIFRIKK